MFFNTYYAREDSGTANNPALNPTGSVSVQITFVAETPSGDPGDLYLDQPAGGGSDPDTVVMIGGTTYSFTYELTGTLPTQNSNGAQQVPEQLEGDSVTVITIADYPAPGETTRFFFLDGQQTTQAEMDAFGNGAIDIQNLNTEPPPTAVCFLQGMHILTPGGECPVETLQVGDLVTTLDDGPLPIRWIASTAHVWPGSPDNYLPIKISAGALGLNRPHRDLVVSPQHKMLAHVPPRIPAHDRMDGGRDVLLPAKGMTGMRGVRSMAGKRHAVYYHLLLDQHAILFCEGAHTESFFPGQTALKMLTPRQRWDIWRYFPALRSDPETGYGPKARPCLSVGDTKKLIQKHRNTVQLFAFPPEHPSVGDAGQRDVG